MIVSIIILIYEDVKYNRTHKHKFIILRVNNEYVRNILKERGLSLSKSAYYSTNKYLYVSKDGSIHGFYRR